VEVTDSDQHSTLFINAKSITTLKGFIIQALNTRLTAFLPKKSFENLL
jgi:hypothetical protein